MTKTNLKIFGFICLAIFLLAAPAMFAQDELDDFGMDDPELSGTSSETPPAESGGTPAPKKTRIDPSLSEKDQIDLLAKETEFNPENRKKDPFKPLVVKKVVLPPVRRVKPRTTPKTFKRPKPVVKPIKLFVSGIVGNEGSRLAIVKFENKEHTITKDQVVAGKFKVVDIFSDRVVVYSNKEQRRHTFRIGGKTKGGAKGRRR